MAVRNCSGTQALARTCDEVYVAACAVAKDLAPSTTTPVRAGRDVVEHEEGNRSDQVARPDEVRDPVSQMLRNFRLAPSRKNGHEVADVLGCGARTDFAVAHTLEDRVRRLDGSSDRSGDNAPMNRREKGAERNNEGFVHRLSRLIQDGLSPGPVPKHSGYFSHIDKKNACRAFGDSSSINLFATVPRA